jgi:hypothetical protein
MNIMIVSRLIQVLATTVGPTVAKAAALAFLAAIEEAVQRSETEVDDQIILPIIAVCRKSLD